MSERPAAKSASIGNRAQRRIAFEPITDGTRPADAIQAQVRGLIASQQIKAGDRLPSERDLSEQFGVSRNSVRQAVRSLADAGLLEVKKGVNGGAFIRDGGASAVRASFGDLYALGTLQPAHLTEARLLIGVEVVRLASERASEDELAQLEQNVRDAERAARTGDLDLRSELNAEFFSLLARMTHNPVLQIVMDAVTEVTLKFAVHPSSRSAMPFGRQLLDDLRAGDANGAAERMREHLARLQKIYLAGDVARARSAGDAAPASGKSRAAPARPAKSAVKPAAKPAVKLAAKPAGGMAAKVASKGTAKGTAKGVTKGATKGATKVAARPAPKPAAKAAAKSSAKPGAKPATKGGAVKRAPAR